MSTQQEKNQVSFGNGRYSAWASTQYNGMIEQLHISEDKAEVIARQMMVDIGAVMKGDSKISIGKANGDNKSNIKEILKAKGATLTNPLSIARALEWMGDAFKNGINFQTTGWELKDELVEYVSGLEVKS